MNAASIRRQDPPPVCGEWTATGWCVLPDGHSRRGKATACVGRPDHYQPTPAAVA